MRTFTVILVGLLVISMSGLAYAEELDSVGTVVERIVESSEVGAVAYFNGVNEGRKFKATRTPFITVGEEFPVDISLVVVDKDGEYDTAGAVTMEILDALNLLAKAVDQKIEFRQSERFSFGIGADVNKRLLEFKPDVFGYASFKIKL